MDFIDKLYTDINQILLERKRGNWENSWMWKADKLEYYFLLYRSNSCIQYSDIDDLDIEIQKETNKFQYRVDIKSRYKTHNFWLFNDDSTYIVSEYVKDIIRHQYESIMEKYRILDLSSDAYYDRQPTFILSEIRDKKLDQLLS